MNHLAQSVTPNKDGPVWTVKLKPGLTWHDGKPVTADDVVFLRADRRPEGPEDGRRDAAGLKPGGTKKVDNLTVQFQLSPANVVFPEGLAFRGSQLVPQGFDTMLKAGKPIGCGPFKLTASFRATSSPSPPFEHYWAGTPYVDSSRSSSSPTHGARQRPHRRHRGCHLGAAQRARPR